MIARGGTYWADLGAPVGSRPAQRRAVIVVSADAYNLSRLGRVIVLAISLTTDFSTMPGNVFLTATATGLPHGSVVNATAVATLNKADLAEQVGSAPIALLHEIDRGLRISLGL